jgi:two-component system response regulator LytT
MMLDCIAVDDEPLALGLVSNFIERTPFLSLSGNYSSAVEALQTLDSNKIDLIFLDIQMPDLTGIELARVLEKSTNSPRIIFTTAYNHFALEGYKVDALDYLLKPFNYEEFLRAANKAKAYYEMKNQAALPGAASQQEEYIFLKVEYQMVKVPLKSILFIEGLKDYVKVHIKNEQRQILTLTSLKSLEDRLPSGRFMRVHRSYIVNLDQINAVTRNSIIIGNITIPVSDQYKDEFNLYLSKWM